MLEKILSNIFTLDFLFSVVRMSTPLLFSSMAGLMTTRAGITNIIIDGTMLSAALVGTLVSAYTQNIWIALLAGLLTGIGLKLFLGFFHLKMDTPANLTGVAINLLTSGGTVFLTYVLAGDKGSTSKLASLTFPKFNIPIIKDIPFIGPVLSGHNILTYVALLSVLVVYIVLFKTPLGLRIRATGETPEAIESVGENPNRIKYISLIMAGVFAALGGMYLSMGYVSWFTRGMTNSRGFIGIAANAIGQSSPILVMLAAFLFATVEAVGNVLQAMQLPIEFIMAMPYVVTLIVLTFNGVRETRKEEKERSRALKTIKNIE